MRHTQRQWLLALCPLVPMFGCAAFTFANLSFNWFEFPYYADYSWVADFIRNSTAAPRWLIHLKIQTAIFHTLESMFFARPYMPTFVHDPLSLARALNVLLLVLVGVHCYGSYPRLRGTIAWVVTSAAYCFMATGYGKVYGAATAILLLTYCVLGDSEFGESGVIVGVISALIGLYYLVLLPIAIAILMTLLIKRPKAFLPALLSFMVAGYALVTIFSGQNVASYFESLWVESHFGNPFTDYAPYRNQAASANSIFFKLPFIFSVKHLGDKLYMLFFAGSLISVVGACYEAGRFLVRRGLIRRLEGLTPMAVFSWLGFGFYLIILVGYMSKIGPRMDLAFYSPFVVPFTFIWFELRRARGAGDLSTKPAWIGQVAYMAMIVVWSGIVGPPEI